MCLENTDHNVLLFGEGIFVKVYQTFSHVAQVLDEKCFIRFPNAVGKNLLFLEACKVKVRDLGFELKLVECGDDAFQICVLDVGNKICRLVFGKICNANNGCFLWASLLKHL
jgi:hypothetical protein